MNKKVKNIIIYSSIAILASVGIMLGYNAIKKDDDESGGGGGGGSDGGDVNIEAKR